MTENSSTTINNWLIAAVSTLRSASIQSARLDSLLLLCDELGKDKAWILAHDEDELTPDKIALLDKKVARRVTHEPLAYIRGTVEFYSRDFSVSRDVLVPRPESEAMISLLKNLEEPPATIIDVGTGSGSLAITAALETPQATVIATDIDPRCLAVAQKNARILGAAVTCIESDLLESINSDRLSEGSVLLANLPYVPQNYPINQAATHEPHLALFSGSSGLDHYTKLFVQATALPTPPSYIITESLYNQHHALAELARKHMYVLVDSEGLAQCFALEVRS
ncbi:MAG: release factor glutamine methyltransferase [Patescibacteria group bacterium]|nr:peptide chain release factor N(5)-glutamine methyltransferase [Candidatus Saccharibacteria bacterium]MDQ5963693.1 release factor glutamine methyltransferase [Patescibacteria group bacterium]